MPSISDQTERAVNGFVQDAVSHLAEVLNDSAPEFENETLWERGTDGHFRERKKRIRRLWPILSDEWLNLRPNHEACVECLKADAIVGPHLDRLIGTSMSTSRLEANDILMSLIYAMVDDEKHLVFSDEKFRIKWQELISSFRADQIVSKTVATLPYLVVPTLPLQLNNEVVLDRLTDEEVTRCYQVGVIRPISPRFPLIYGEIAVGIRRTMVLPKLIKRDDEPLEPIDAKDEGSFGNRPLYREGLVIDDVLSALRLFKHTQIRATGLATWCDFPWLSSGTSFQIIGQWPYGGKLELSEDEVPRFLALWRLLETGATRFGFSIHRFNLAFDRRLLIDRIVDLVIAAEALFLSDLGVKDRGELRFRFALRAAKFIQHPSYGEREIFRIMRQAYDARSAIVHGGLPDETHLPDNQSADLPTFIDIIEELIRLGLCKALSMEEDGSKIRQPAYWDDLVLSKSDPSQIE